MKGDLYEPMYAAIDRVQHSIPERIYANFRMYASVRMALAFAAIMIAHLFFTTVVEPASDIVGRFLKPSYKNPYSPRETQAMLTFATFVIAALVITCMCSYDQMSRDFNSNSLSSRRGRTIQI